MGRYEAQNKGGFAGNDWNALLAVVTERVPNSQRFADTSLRSCSLTQAGVCCQKHNKLPTRAAERFATRV
jgi:hypothetical protein